MALGIQSDAQMMIGVSFITFETHRHSILVGGARELGVIYFPTNWGAIRVVEVRVFP